MASFGGTLNVLSAQVASAAEGRLTIDGQEIRAAKPLADAAPNQPINVALRPEIISMNGSASSIPNSTNHLAGTVEDVMFLGPTVRVRVRFGEQALQFDEVNNPHLNPPARGAQITVSFPPEACLILSGA